MLKTLFMISLTLCDTICPTLYYEKKAVYMSITFIRTFFSFFSDEDFDPDKEKIDDVKEE